jgi:hypothetical protein
MSKAKRIREERAEREAREREEAWYDPRLTATHAKHVPGARLSRVPYVLAVVSPLRLPDGRELWFQAPQPVAFNLLEAKRFRDSGEAKRVEAMANLKERRKEDQVQPADTSLVLDALADLSAAVLFSFAAIEALANHTIDQLEDGTTYVDNRGREQDKEGMVRWLAIEEKLRGPVLLFTKAAPLDKGREPWQSFKRLKDLRDDLVHAKRRNYSTDPDHPAVYGRLLQGDGSKCVEEAFALADELRPDFFPENVRQSLAADW